MEYAEFLATKQSTIQAAGFEWSRSRLPRSMHGWQKDVTLWALRLGRAALFLDTGLGKTLMELAWAAAVAKHTGRPVLLLCPLAVAQQTVREAGKFGIKGVKLVETQADIDGPGVYVTNFHKLHHFDPTAFGGIVLDESSIIKSFTGKIRNQLKDFCAGIPYRLFATATPAPNDYEELGNHAELLGVCTRVEMLATYFIHDSADTSKWRLKGHAEAAFWAWVGSWAMVMRTPADLGYPSEGYDLPPLNIHEHCLTAATPADALWAAPAATLTEQRKARRETLSARVAKAAEIANATDEPCIVWCELNDEADESADLIGGAYQVAGSDTDEHKTEGLNGFSDGRHAKLVTKCSIAGFGMNWQHCRKMVFVGVSHSFEQFYQAVRRCWRYGQTRDVEVHVITSDAEYEVWQNVQRKQRQHADMAANMIGHTALANKAALKGGRTVEAEGYKTGRAAGPGWEMRLGDSCELIKEIPDNSVHYSVFSPPFASLYTYSNSPRDMGNSGTTEEFYTHFRFLVRELLRVLKPGRNLSFHCMNLPTSKERDGIIGIRDFRGDMIRMYVEEGWIYHSEVCIWKNPVVAMQRTKALGLLHKQIKKDSCMSRMGIADYVVTMRKPGENAERVGHTAEEFPVDKWQSYASPVWMDIDQTDTLNIRPAREDKDERHICPLQLQVIGRCLELWTNPGDLVLSPFGGIGSEGYQSILQGRKFIGMELKPRYFEVACGNLERAVTAAKNNSVTLFDDLEGTGWPAINSRDYAEANGETVEEPALV